MRSLTFALLLLVTLATAPGCGGSEARKAKALERGQEYLASRDYAKARVEFRNALQIDPKDAAARTLLGEAAERLGNYEEAVNSYRAALELDPGQATARARLGRMMVFGGVPDQALELVAPGLERDPRSADLLTVRGAARVQQGDVAAGRADAEAALAAEPNHSDATALLATLLWREERRDEALALLGRTIEASPDDVLLREVYAQLLLTTGDAERAEQQLEEIVRLEPDVQAHRYRLAQSYASRGKTQPAIATLRDAVVAKPGDTEAKLALATLLASKVSFEAAEKELLGFVEAAPKDLDLRLGVARFYETNGRVEFAEREYRAVMEAAGDRSQGLAARSRLASIQIRRGEMDEATKLVDAVLEQSPSDPDALVMRAQMAMQRGDTDAAIVDLRAALRDQPTNVLLVVQLAQAYIRSGNLELAEQTLRQAVQSNPRDAKTRLALAQFLVNKGEAGKARPVLEQLVRDEPNDAEAVEGLARLLLIVNDPAAALQAATTLQTLRPNSSAGFLIAGIALQALGRGEEAHASLERATAVDPNALDPLAALMQLEVASGESAKALVRVEERLARQPKDAALLNLKGDLLLAMEKPAEAAASFAAASRARPDWPQPYRSHARVLAAMGDADAAIEVLRGGLAATNQSVEIALDLGAMLAVKGRADEAIQTFEGVLASTPNDVVALNNLAMLLANHRKDDASLERAGQLVERFARSDNPAFLDTYGWVAYRRGRYAEAVTALEKAVSLAPDAPELRYHLGMAQLASGDRTAGRRSLEAAMGAGQEFQGMDEARAALSKL